MTNNIRILHIIPNFGPGGAERLVVDLMGATDKEHFDVVAVSLYPESGTILEKEIREKKTYSLLLKQTSRIGLKDNSSALSYISNFPTGYSSYSPLCITLCTTTYTLLPYPSTSTYST